MKTLFLFLVVLAYVSAKRHPDYEKFLNKHGKKNKGLTDEDVQRRENNFFKNKKMIDDHNNNSKKGFKLAENEFSDRDTTNFVKEKCRTQLPATVRALPVTPAVNPPTTPAPSSIDWTSKCLPIVHQGNCGSCWAFAVAATIESYNLIRNKPIQPLSQQNIVDCDINDGGCGGGWPTNAFNFVKNNMGTKLAQSTDYSYAAVQGTCKNVANPLALNYASVFQKSVNGDEAQMMSIIANYGPVTIAMWVSDNGIFQNFGTGIHYDSSCPSNQCNQVNHAMVAVGYSKDADGNAYWIVRNSWGTGWGDQGYIRMAKDRGNNCNVACWAMGVE